MLVLEGTSPHPGPLSKGERVRAFAAVLPPLAEAGNRGPFRLAFVAIAAALIAAGFTASEARAENMDLRVDVSGLRNYKGRVVVMLWADSENNSSFPDPTKVQFRDERPGDPPCDFSQGSICRRTVESLQNLTVSYTFRDIPPGDYAVFTFHDENNNGVLDTGLFHRPLEGRGYSQVLPEDLNPIAARITFHRARFPLPVSRTIVIGLRYPPRF